MKKTILSLLLLALPLGAAEPIKALLITGGCCHDYVTVSYTHLTLPTKA